MSYAPHMELVTELLPLLRRDFYTDIDLKPDSAHPLLDGEWLKLTDAYKVARGGSEQAAPNYPVWAEKGRYDVQAIGKVPLLMGPLYEFDTDICNTPHGFQVGDPAVVSTVTVLGDATRMGLIKPSGSVQHLIVAWCTRLPASGKVRFVHTGYTYGTF